MDQNAFAIANLDLASQGIVSTIPDEPPEMRFACGVVASLDLYAAKVLLETVKVCT